MSEIDYPPVIIPRNYSDYIDNAHNRTREEDMNTSTQYSFIAELIGSHYGAAGEFQAKLSKVLTDEVGRTSLLLCLLDPEAKGALVLLDSTSNNGFITPDSSRRIYHNRLQNIGTVSEGYLLGPDVSFAPTTLAIPQDLDAQAHWSGPHDTRTGVLHLQGIEVSNN